MEQAKSEFEPPQFADGHIVSVSGLDSTELHKAVEEGDEPQALVLLKGGADINAKDHLGNTPILIASQKTRRMAKLLFDHHANIFEKNNQGVFPLLEATNCGKVPIVKYLFEMGADIKDKDFKGHTALYYAIMNRNLELVKYLVEKGSTNNDRFESGFTYLMVAVNTTSRHKAVLPIVEYLLETFSDVNERNAEGTTALMIAARNDQLPLVSTLLNLGADIHATNAQGQNALFAPSALGHIKIVELLLSRGVNSFARDAEGKTAMDYASDHRRRKIRAVLDQTRIAQGMAAGGATSKPMTPASSIPSPMTNPRTFSGPSSDRIGFPPASMPLPLGSKRVVGKGGREGTTLGAGSVGVTGGTDDSTAPPAATACGAPREWQWPRQGIADMNVTQPASPWQGQLPTLLPFPNLQYLKQRAELETLFEEANPASGKDAETGNTAQQRPILDDPRWPRQQPARKQQKTQLSCPPLARSSPKVVRESRSPSASPSKRPRPKPRPPNKVIAVESGLGAVMATENAELQDELESQQEYRSSRSTTSDSNQIGGDSHDGAMAPYLPGLYEFDFNEATGAGASSSTMTGQLGDLQHNTSAPSLTRPGSLATAAASGSGSFGMYPGGLGSNPPTPTAFWNTSISSPPRMSFSWANASPRNRNVEQLTRERIPQRQVEQRRQPKCLAVEIRDEDGVRDRDRDRDGDGDGDGDNEDR